MGSPARKYRRKKERERNLGKSQSYRVKNRRGWGVTWECKEHLAAMPYAEYLKSRYWQDVRRQFLKSAHFKCQKCGAKDCELHVHHVNYDHRGIEWMHPGDIKVLCKSCHEAEHGIHTQ